MRRGGILHGYLNNCPHRDLPLNRFPDRFLDHSVAYIQCANHGALYNIAGGLCDAGPCAGRLAPVGLVVVADEIWLGAPAPGAG